MHSAVDTRDPDAVQREVQAAYLEIFPEGDARHVPEIFAWAVDCFSGRRAGYQPIDASYHDLEHTLQGTLCMARLLLGRHRAGARPAAGRRTVELGLLAILLHDTGYLKAKGDDDGTGAKYTVTHVSRSAEFAGRLMGEKGFGKTDIQAVQNMILCTGVDSQLNQIAFQSEEERILGHALATADLLGQMAAPDYVDKLPELYEEFAEGARHDHERSGIVDLYHSAGELIRSTPAFWREYVVPKLEKEFGGLYKFLNDPFPDGPNPYVEQVEAHMRRLRQEPRGGAGK